MAKRYIPLMKKAYYTAHKLIAVLLLYVKINNAHYKRPKGESFKKVCPRRMKKPNLVAIKHPCYHGR
jgi:hypothetical protein